MTIALEYLSDLSRVRIALSDLPDGTVRVQRALNADAADPLWTTVRGGESLEVIGGVATLDDYEFVPDVENFYRVVPVDPPAGLLVGASGDTASTPDHASLDITGTLTVAWYGLLDTWNTGGTQVLVNKYEGGTPGQRSFRFIIDAAGLPALQWSTDGETGGLSLVPSNAALDVEDGQPLALVARLEASIGGNHTVTFYTADELPANLTSGLTVLGTQQQFSGTTSVHAGTASLVVAAGDGGEVFEARVVDGNLGGTTVADPDFTAQTQGTTSFTDDTGKLWTVNGNARIIGVEIDSITPSLDGRVWLKSIRYPGLNRPLFRVLDQGDDIAHPDRGSVYEVTGRAAPISVEDVQGSRRFTLLIQAESDSQAAALEIMFQVGGVLFVHVPPDKPVPGGYVHVGQVRRQRPTTLVRHRFVVPCTVVAKPSADVVGTTLTVGQLIAEHDSIESVWAAYPSIRDMWDDIGDINDLVVI